MAAVWEVPSPGDAWWFVVSAWPRVRVAGSVWGTHSVWPQQGGDNGALVVLTCGLCFALGLKCYLVPGELLQYLLRLSFVHLLSAGPNLSVASPHLLLKLLPDTFQASRFFMFVFVFCVSSSLFSLWLSCTSSWVCGFLPDCFYRLWRCKDQLIITHISFLLFQWEGTKLRADFAFILFN